MEEQGLVNIAKNMNIIPQKGDIAIIQPPDGAIHGHMAIYNGVNWVSDFVQQNMTDGRGGMFPGPSYRASSPDVIIYRKQTEKQIDKGSEIEPETKIRSFTISGLRWM